MLRPRGAVSRRPREEAEKPFWISFADLMTALMVLFLVVMSVTLLSVTSSISAAEREQKQLDKDIERMLDNFEKSAAKFPGITIDRNRRVISFGTRAQFALRSSSLTGEQKSLLRAFVPEILSRANDEVGKRVLKRIVVEGYTDKTGSYLFNLNLSLDRSQRVLCAMFEPPAAGERPLTRDELQQIRALFLVGGYSFNLAKDSDEESRRVEMRLEFLGLRERRPSLDTGAAANLGACALE